MKISTLLFLSFIFRRRHTLLSSISLFISNHTTCLDRPDLLFLALFDLSFLTSSATAIMPNAASDQRVVGDKQEHDAKRLGESDQLSKQFSKQLHPDDAKAQGR